MYAHVSSREHREDKRTTRPDTYIHIYKHSPRRGTHFTINVGLAQARPNKANIGVEGCILNVDTCTNDPLALINWSSGVYCILQS